jgi:hypothetical protein
MKTGLDRAFDMANDITRGIGDREDDGRRVLAFLFADTVPVGKVDAFVAADALLLGFLTLFIETP